MCNEKSEKTRDGSPASGGGVLQKLYRKGNTMTEKKQKQKDAEAKIKAALGDALAAEMGDIPKASITIEELKALELEDRKNKRKRIVRFIGVAAVIMLIFGAAVYAVWPQTAVPVDADKNTEQKVEEKDGVVVINEGEAEGEAGEVVIEETDWSKVKKYQEKTETLRIPTYVPKEYKFKQFRLEKFSKKDFLAEYTYVKNGQLLTISQRKQLIDIDVRSSLTQGNAQKIRTKSGDCWIIEEKNEPKILMYYLSKEHITIVGRISNEKIIKILEGYHVP